MTVGDMMMGMEEVLVVVDMADAVVGAALEEVEEASEEDVVVADGMAAASGELVALPSLPPSGFIGTLIAAQLARRWGGKL